MTADAPFTPPRKKLNILWWLGGFCLLLIGIFFLQLFGPDPKIVVSPQTTYVTRPLRADGMPDYRQYVLDLYREGVTPENNAGAIIWPVLWPGELNPPEYAAVAKELGLKQIPSQKDALVPQQKVWPAVVRWLNDPSASQSNGDTPVEFPSANEPAAEDDQIAVPSFTEDDAALLFEKLTQRSWTSQQIPPIAKWVNNNKQPLDRLLEASRRTRCYFPSPNYISGQGDMVFAMLLPGQQGARSVGRSLPVRAMWHLGEGRVDEAWQDLLATHRIARLVAQGHTLVEQLIGIAIHKQATDATITLLHEAKLSPEQARQIQRDLAALPEFTRMADSLDRMERVCFLDVITHFGQMGKEELELMSVGEQMTYINAFSINWNIVMRRGNEYYDRLVAASRMPSGPEREQAMSQITGDVMALGRDIHEPATIAGAVFSPSGRSEAIASAFLNLFLPAIEAATNAQDRANTELLLARLAAALARYRAQHGAYPEKLDDLVPALLDKLPVDVHSAAPLVYKREGEGFLLYSAGENGKDDGGSNEQQRIYTGQALDDLDEAEAESWQSKIPAGADDISIGVPRPALKLPQISPLTAP